MFSTHLSIRQIRYHAGFVIHLENTKLVIDAKIGGVIISVITKKSNFTTTALSCSQMMTFHQKCRRALIIASKRIPGARESARKVRLHVQREQNSSHQMAL